MKVIFIEDVPNVGRVGQTRVVADGYARNYLFPRRLAVLADSPAAAALDAQLKKRMKLRALEEAELAELARKINGIDVTLKARIGENEKLYGSITAADIADELTRVAGREIDKRKIDLPEPIKQAGTSEVTVRFTHDITAVFRVNIVSDEAVVEKPPVPETKAEKPKKAKKERPEAAKAEKPPKEKKAKALEAAGEEKQEAVAGAEEEKKEKKPRARAKKTEAAEKKKES